MKHLRTGLALLLAFSLTGCIHWYRSEPIAADRSKVWQSVREAVSREYLIDEAETNDKDGVLLTKWDYRMSPYYREGYRHKVEVELETFEGDSKKPEKDRRWVVKLRVYKEINDNVATPLAKQEAEWKDSIWWDKKEAELMFHVMLPFKNLGVSDYALRAAAQKRPSNSHARETRPLARERAVVWKALVQVCGEMFDIASKHEKSGKLTSTWQLRGGDPEVATVRTRLTVRLLPDTSAKVAGPVFRVEVRVDQQRLETPRDGGKKKWVADGRDNVGEDMIADHIEKAVVAAR